MDDIRGEPRIRLSGPSGLLAAVPSTLGFHPTNSLVLMCFSGTGHALGPVARVDLPRGRDPDLARHLTGTALTHADEVAVVCYPRTRRRPQMLDELLRELARAEVDVLAALIVHAGRMWPALTARTLRLSDGMPVPDHDHPDMKALAAANALSGRVVLADRAELRASVAGPRGRRRSLAERAIGAVAQGRGCRPPDPCGCAAEALPDDAGMTARVAPLPARVENMIEGALAQVQALGTVDVRLAAELAVACLDPCVRDAVVVRGVLDLDRSWLAMLISCATWTPEAYAAGICAVLATLAYRHGDGALAQVSVDRCLQAEPGNPMAHLLIATMSAGMPPDVLDGLLIGPDDLAGATDEPPDDRFEEWTDEPGSDNGSAVA